MNSEQTPQSENVTAKPITPECSLECYGNMDEHYSYKCSTLFEGDIARLCTKATLTKKIKCWPFLVGLIPSHLSEDDQYYGP